MQEYFIQANSFAAPFCSDTSEAFITADSPKEALEEFASKYSHPCGLFAAEAYSDANAFHKGAKPLARWLCNHEIEKQRITEGIPGGYSYLGRSPGDFEIDGVRHQVQNPKQGRVVESAHA